MSGDQGLRIGDHERAAAADRLCAHTAAGRLALDELEERLDRANRAVFAGDLGSVEADLPTSAPIDLPSPTQTSPRRRPVHRRPSTALIVLLLAAVLARLFVGHPIAPRLILVALLWRSGGRRLRPRPAFPSSLP